MQNFHIHIFFIFLLTGLIMPGARTVQAQASDGVVPVDQPPVDWRLVADGRAEDWSPSTPYPLDSLHTAAQQALRSLQREGYYFAQIDSAHIDTSRTLPQATFFASRGPEVEVVEVVVIGAIALDSLALLRQMDTRPGRRLDPEKLEDDLAAILDRYDDAGFPLANARIDDLVLLPGDPPRLRVVITIDEGRTLTLQGVELDGAARTRASYAARVAGLKKGQSLDGYDPVEIQQRLDATDFFRSVGAPELLITADTVATIRIPVVEEAPGAFDLVLGYLPSDPGGMGGGLVGNGHLELRNLFGQGRVLALQLDRLPGRVSSVEARAVDPFIAGLPLRAEVRFNGIQQDSTYGQQRYGAEIGVQIIEDFEVFSSISREITKPGQAGLTLIGGKQRIARSEVTFLGLGARYRRIDRRFNPRRGLLVETNLERGSKERIAREAIGEAPPEVRRTQVRQERLRAQLRAFIPTFARQVFVFGSDVAVLLSNEYDASDLFRFGGATSLRGYNEEQFRGNGVARAFAEYRYQLDRTSYAFVFFDLGYVELPAIEDQPSTKGFHTGYGVGAEVGTDLGLVTFSLAANPDDPTGLRAHLGLSIGL